MAKKFIICIPPHPRGPTFAAEAVSVEWAKPRDIRRADNKNRTIVVKNRGLKAAVP